MFGIFLCVCVCIGWLFSAKPLCLYNKCHEACAMQQCTHQSSFNKNDINTRIITAFSNVLGCCLHCNLSCAVFSLLL